MTNDRINEIIQKLKSQFFILIFFVVAFWIIEIIDSLGGGWLEVNGIQPRSFSKIYGILLAPLLHADFLHLAGNTIPFIILGWFVLLQGSSKFSLVFIISAITSGIGVWFIGSSQTIHIGASGVIFGFLGFLLANAFFEKSSRAIILSVVALLMYGGILWGLLPSRIGISWEGHLFGFLGGIITAKLITNNRDSDTHKGIYTNL